MSNENFLERILFSDNFENGITDVWVFEGNWRIKKLRSGYFLVGMKHSWAKIQIGKNWSDFSFKCHLKLIRGTVQLNYRLSDNGRYIIGFTRNGLYLKKETPLGKFSNLATSDTIHDLNILHHIEIFGEKGNLKVYVDGNMEIDFNDPRPLTKGTIALEPLDNSEIHLKNIKIALKAELVSLIAPKKPLFLGSYAKIPILINSNSGLTMNDLDLVVPAGKKGGIISFSHDGSFDSANPDIMLLAGYKSGTYELHAIQKSTNSIVAKGVFSINAFWTNELEGPSHWVTGDYELPGVAGATWGGGSFTDPENFNNIPAIGKRNLAILLLDTSSSRFTQTEIQTVRNLWQDIVFDGRLKNGKIISTAHYFHETSYNKLNIKGEVFGPVELPGSWNDYLKNNGDYKKNLFTACAEAGDSLINYLNFQHLVCVIKSVPATATTPKRRVWAHADAIEMELEEGNIAIGVVDMPADGNPFNLSITLAHELGHNFGLEDIYEYGSHPPQIIARALGGWALMANQGGLPHPVLVNRMKLGWILKNSLKLYNFQAIGGFVDETITLHPVELSNPPAGRYSGIEVRIAPGLNYYFEYRVAQTTHIGDQMLPVNDRVLGTDAMFLENLEDAARRKPVMLLPNDIDGDGSVLGTGQDYKEQDTSPPDGPNFPTDFTATITNIDGVKADVRIQYGIYSQPDPSIRPWNPPVYQSPDIEVRNARSQADAKWLNVPWENNHNRLIAKVTNRGALNAPNVWVDFYVTDYTVNRSGTQSLQTRIGYDNKDIPANKTVEFETIWMSGKAGHYCIEARIRHYMTPGPNPVLEATEYNNRAQSNYDRFISATSSAPSREVALVKVHNPFDKTTTVSIRVVKSTSLLYRTYLEHTWLKLQPGETKDIQVMFEYIDSKVTSWNPNLEQYIGKPNNVSIDAVIDEPDGEPEQAPIILGGLSAQVITGRATKVTDFIFDPPKVYGRIKTVDTEDSVSGGKVILIIKRNVEKIEYQESEVSEEGFFSIDVSGNWRSIQAYYVPSEGYADSTSNVIEIDSS